ncbi:MAG: hypothetical protein KKB66_04310 [Alphaproteobacteria bacterium]|nr:hypothetical protein [Alphaproteobacteria bacterium]MBU0802887.1 hypothetical protein [Alphaproteobacteria bacterium]MBU0871684.1 hypothetical protein [Alphaproteobacteria bacterium]MBU1400351.1 hypothetical protein [Alphaproteobacteria bacterium]MBU1590376.1 hypothetical protein [Alphaproteobacteria bacterium]
MKRPALTLPRHLRLAILRLLRPAESAARRLIIAAARGLTVTLPPPRKPRPKPILADPILRRFGIATVLSPADPAAGAFAARAAKETRPDRPLALPLFDPPRRCLSKGPRRRYVPARAVPRICVPGGPHPEVRAEGEPRRTPDDPIDATRLARRLAALAAALDDLPGQAMRFARRQAFLRRAAAARQDTPAHGRPRRTWPLRPGRPPGGRLLTYDPAAPARKNIRDVDEILAHAHSLALHALAHPDTS